MAFPTRDHAATRRLTRKPAAALRRIAVIAALIMPHAVLADSADARPDRERAGERAAERTGGAQVTVVVTGLRSEKGQVMACLTTKARSFPACDRDPQALHLVVPAQNGPILTFHHVMPGVYAVALFHDENGNGKMDTHLGIPAEGYGFSRDAQVWMGPPRFRAAQVVVGGADLTLTIKVRYIL